MMVIIDGLMYDTFTLHLDDNELIYQVDIYKNGKIIPYKDMECIQFIADGNPITVLH